MRPEAGGESPALKASERAPEGPGLPRGKAPAPSEGRAVRTARKAKALPATNRLAQTERFGAPSGKALAHPDGESHPAPGAFGGTAEMPLRRDRRPPAPAHAGKREGRTGRPAAKTACVGKPVICRLIPDDSRPAAGNHYESERSPDTGRKGVFRGNGLPRRQRHGRVLPNDVGDIGYRFGNEARIRFAFAGSGLRRNRGPKDPKGS